MKIAEIGAIYSTKNGLDLAQAIVESLPSEPRCLIGGVLAETFGYRRHFLFDGVEISSAFHNFVLWADDPDRDSAAALLNELLSKIERGLPLSSWELSFAQAPVLCLSLADMTDELCFSLAQIVGHRSGEWVAIECQNLASGETHNLSLSFLKTE